MASTTSPAPIPAAPHPLASQPSVRAVLDRLHALSLVQEEQLHARHAHFPTHDGEKKIYEEQLVALDEDKARDMYLILRAMGARRVVEAGTSYGVSLIWILAAVLENERLSSSSPSPSAHPALVIGTENEPSKATRALSHVRSAFSALPPPLALLEGDLLATLPAASLPERSIDALLLDIWSPLALPTLKILLPKLRVGAVVFVDNTASSEDRYRELLTFLREQGSGFLSSTLPHSGGFNLSVYVGSE
ncbi:hypothetical protein PLICRDRAFT_36314 [Plicaturopsis crispa FD-325 SS-3]|nr:hypothetical protein PLICRDRAFT_36314 [Plicaturopsis crispa FD-325 SS-3]